MVAVLMMAKTSSQIVDVVHDGVRAFLLEQEDEVDVARVGRRGDADERDFGGAGAARVVDGVADVVDAARLAPIGAGRRDAGLWFDDVVHARRSGRTRVPGRSGSSVSSASSRGRPVKTASSNCSASRSSMPGWATQLLAQDQAICRRRGRALEVVLHVVERNVDAGVGDDVVGELPVVVPAALVLVVLDLLAGDGVAGEVLDGLRDGFAVGFGDVHQDAIHIEDEERFASIPDLFQCRQQAAGLLARADGDADAAGGFVAAVAHQDRPVRASASRTSTARLPKWPSTKFAELGTYVMPSFSRPTQSNSRAASTSAT